MAIIGTPLLLGLAGTGGGYLVLTSLAIPAPLHGKMTLTLS